jgi:hypothetical protein
MRTIDGIAYKTKADLKGVFAGLEQYRPGDASVRNLFIRLTSGTSEGIPTMLVVSSKKPEGPTPLFSKPFLFISGRNCLVLPQAQRFFDSNNPSDFLFLGQRDREHPGVASVLRQFAPQQVFSFVSLFHSFIEQLAHRGEIEALGSVEWIMLAGEMISERIHRAIMGYLPRSRIDMRYSFSETAGSACVSCEALSAKYPSAFGRVYHPTMPITILEPDENGVGEIGIRTPELGNYLTGDAGRLVRETCACGAKDTLFIHGRINFDIVHAVGATFQLPLVEKTFDLLRDYVTDYYLEIREVEQEGKMMGSVTVTVVPTQKLLSLPDGVAYISNTLGRNLQLTRTRTLGELIRGGIFLPAKIAYTLALPVTGKKVRMRKVD